MVAVPRSLITIVFICLVGVSLAFGSASNIYITQTGSPSGNCTTNVQTPAFFNNAASWGSGASQIGPGTTVLLCGTFTSSAKGGNVLTVQGSGSAANPVTIQFDTNAQMNSTGWWGGYPEDCSTCTGAITISGRSYITVDGQNNGIIQNMLAGCVQGHSGDCLNKSTATCVAGPCTQSPGIAGTTGIAVTGGSSNILIENLTIANMYASTGSASGVTDTDGVYSTDIAIQSSSAVSVVNNKLNDSSIGIVSNVTGGTGTNTGPSSCPTTQPITSPGSGMCFGFNTFSGHHWHIADGSGGGSGTYNIYNNDISNWTLWEAPATAYHTDGIITYGAANTVTTNYIWNNYFHGNLGNINATGMIYFASDQLSDGSGSQGFVFNNLFVGDDTLNSFIWAGLATTNNPIGPLSVYNNTFVNLGYDIFVMNVSGGPKLALTVNNNIFYGDPNTNQTYFLAANDNAAGPFSSLTLTNNLYYNSRSGSAGNGSWNGSTSLSVWQASCKCDAGSVVSDPNFSASYALNAGSPAIQLGVNLMDVGITQLQFDKAGLPRPLGANWSAGVYQFGGAPASPTGLTASVH